MAIAWGLVFGPERSSGAIVEFPDERTFSIGESLDLEGLGKWRIAEIRRLEDFLPQLILEPIAKSVH